MKSNQLMSIPFNGRANFDQIDFVKCNRERDTHRRRTMSTYARSTSDHRFLRDLRIFNCLALFTELAHSVNLENLFTIFSSIVLTRFVGMLCVIKAGLLSAKIDLQKYIHTHIFNPFLSHCVDGARANANVHKNDKKEEESHAEKCSH